jgi:hypothetical protein
MMKKSLKSLFAPIVLSEEKPQYLLIVKTSRRICKTVLAFDIKSSKSVRGTHLQFPNSKQRIPAILEAGDTALLYKGSAIP